jgi:hypothetical protein
MILFANRDRLLITATVADPTQLLDAFAREGWKSEPFDRMFDHIRTDPVNAFDLLSLAMEREVKNVTFLDAAVSFVPEELLPELAEQAVSTIFRSRDNGLAESVIAYLSLQAVACLDRYLPRFFLERMPNAETYHAFWPWRGASDTHVRQLLNLLQEAYSPDEVERAFRCILESRNPDYLSEAIAAIRPGILVGKEAAYLAEVGFDGLQRRLSSESVFHLRLPPEVLSYPLKPAWLQPSNHPTWTSPAIAGRHRFGGTADSACAICDGPLHNLITLDPTPDGIGIVCPARLQLATCLSCLGWSKAPLFFGHADDGTPTPLDSGPMRPEFPAYPLREVWVELSPTPSRWKWQDWALSNGRENLHRLGGHPTWIQSAEYPTCPGCRRLMPVLLQLDSDLPTQDGHEWLWGSGGICYVFWCGDCSVSGALWQCT